MSLRFDIRKEIASVLVPNFDDLLVCCQKFARSLMILDRLDRRAVVVSKSEDGDRIAHVIGQYLALLCAY